MAAIAPVALLFVAAGFMAWGLVRLGTDAAWVSHSNDVITELRTVQSLVLEQESSLRGHLLTESAEFVESLSRTDVRESFGRLRQLTDDNGTQARHLDQIESYYDTWLALVHEQLARPRGEPLDKDAMRNRKERMVQVRAALSNFVDVELGLRDARKATLTRTTQLLLYAVIPLLVGMGLILGFFSRNQLRDLTSRFSVALDKEREARASEREARAAMEGHAWARAEHAKLSQLLLGDLSAADICGRASRHLALATGAQVVAGYQLIDDTLTLCGHYGLAEDAPREVKLPAGLLGAAVETNELTWLRDVPAGFLKVTSGTGSLTAEHVVVLPASVGDAAYGVLELGFFGAPDARSFDLLNRVGETVAAALQTAQQKRQLRELLEQTQRQAAELERQREELAARNEELQRQSSALVHAHRELEERQSRLENTNETLAAQKSQLESLSQALQAKADDLARTNRYKSEFVANMSHELRTPLNSALILAKVLAENKLGNLDAEQVKYAETICAAGHDLHALINDILDLAKVEAGKIDLQASMVPISTLVDTLSQTFAPVSASSGVAFEVIGDLEPELETDLQRVQQILRNLLSNAFKFTERGKVTLEVRVDVERVQFLVTDTGIGIASDNLEDIFEAFRQADGTTNRRFGGTGLGLSIARDLARLLGGDVGVESTPDVGSTFTLSLPRALTVAPPRAPTPQRGSLARPVGWSVSGASSSDGPRNGSPRNGSPLDGSPRNGSPRNGSPLDGSPRNGSPLDDRELATGDGPILLVVEDDKSFASIVRDVGRELGFRCLLASTAEEAIALTRQHLPSAVVLDLRLPDHSGLVVLDHVSQDPATRHVPVHVMSAADEIRAAQQLGAVGYALKPVTREEIVQAVQGMRDQGVTPRRLLAIEPHASLLSQLGTLFERSELEVTAAPSVAAAIETATASPFDCLLTELGRAEPADLDRLEMLVREGGDRLPPIIAFSDRALTEEEEERVRRSAQAIVVTGSRPAHRLQEELTHFLRSAMTGRDGGAAVERARGDGRSLRDRTILLADDDVRNVFALTSVLESHGARVRTARNGRQAVDMLGSHPDIELVLMDIMMPEMDGIAATTAIRGLAGDAGRVPIIAITAQAMQDDQARCLAVGANDYVPKPLDVDILLSLIRVWLP